MFFKFQPEKKSLELKNIFFETSSQKGMFWQNKKNFDFSSLIYDSRNILTASLKNHFRLTRNTCELLTREILASGVINVRNAFGRAPIPPEKQILVYLWMMANGSETTRQVADRFNITMSSCGRVLQRVNSAVLSMRQRYIKWPNGKAIVFILYIHTYIQFGG